MVLPAGVNKATGLAAALKELQLSPHNVVAVGDAESDHAFLRACGCAAAVANALPMLKETADIRLAGARGAGVAELVEMICHDDARIIPPERHGLAVGALRDGRLTFIEPHCGSVLIAGRSGIGKSTLAIALTERMTEKGFEFCIFDPEGDYDGLDNAISLGDGKTPPQAEEALQLLQKAEFNITLNTQALDVAERPQFFAQLLPEVGSLRARTGRPHWLIIDEAHHLLPQARGNLPQLLPEELPAAIFVTVHRSVSADALRTVEVVIALGERASEVIAAFCQATDVQVPSAMPRPAADEVLIWYRYLDAAPEPLRVTRPKQAHRRHTQKYAEGDVGRGPQLFTFVAPRRRSICAPKICSYFSRSPTELTTARGSIIGAPAIIRAGFATSSRTASLPRRRRLSSRMGLSIPRKAAGASENWCGGCIPRRHTAGDGASRKIPYTSSIDQNPCAQSRDDFTGLVSEPVPRLVDIGRHGEVVDRCQPA